QPSPPASAPAVVAPLSRLSPNRTRPPAASGATNQSQSKTSEGSDAPPPPPMPGRGGGSPSPARGGGGGSPPVPADARPRRRLPLPRARRRQWLTLDHADDALDSVGDAAVEVARTEGGHDHTVD